MSTIKCEACGTLVTMQEAHISPFTSLSQWLCDGCFFASVPWKPEEEEAANGEVCGS